MEQEYIIQGETLKNIGDSIRAKKNTTAVFSPAQMAVEIDGIPVGNDLPIAEEVSFGTVDVGEYENGILYPSNGFFSSVWHTEPYGTNNFRYSIASIRTLGFAFTAKENFSIHSIGFIPGYGNEKSINTPLPTTLKVWDVNTGTVLAEKTITPALSLNTMYAQLNSPINVEAGSDYIVSIFSSVYACHNGTFNIDSQYNEKINPVGYFDSDTAGTDTMPTIYFNGVYAIDFLIGPPLTESVITEYKIQKETMTNMVDAVKTRTGIQGTMTPAQATEAIYGIVGDGLPVPTEESTPGQIVRVKEVNSDGKVLSTASSLVNWSELQHKPFGFEYGGIILYANQPEDFSTYKVQSFPDFPAFPVGVVANIFMDGNNETFEIYDEIHTSKALVLDGNVVAHYLGNPKIIPELPDTVEDNGLFFCVICTPDVNGVDVFIKPPFNSLKLCDVDRVTKIDKAYIDAMPLPNEPSTPGQIVRVKEVNSDGSIKSTMSASGVLWDEVAFKPVGFASGTKICESGAIEVDANNNLKETAVAISTPFNVGQTVEIYAYNSNGIVYRDIHTFEYQLIDGNYIICIGNPSLVSSSAIDNGLPFFIGNIPNSNQIVIIFLKDFDNLEIWNIKNIKTIDRAYIPSAATIDLSTSCGLPAIAPNGTMVYAPTNIDTHLIGALMEKEWKLVLGFKIDMGLEQPIEVYQSFNTSFVSSLNLIQCAGYVDVDGAGVLMCSFSFEVTSGATAARAVFIHNY